MRLDYVRLLVSKFDDCYRFYRDVMGFKVTWGKEGWSYASFDVGKMKLSLFKRDLMARDVGTTNLPSDVKSQDRVAFIYGVKNVDVEAKRLRESGTRLITRTTDHPDYGIRSVHLRDPDGNLIEIYSQLPKKKWTKELLNKNEMSSRE